MISIRFKNARELKDRWKEAYGWLSKMKRYSLLRLCRQIMNYEGGSFQEKLEYAAYRLIEEPFD
jgi:hypothetical protein